MGQTLSNADAALKNFYLDPVRDQINNKNVLLEYVSKGKVDAEGRYAVLSLHTRRNSSVGARADGNYLPGTLIAGTTTAIGQQGFAEQRVSLKQLWGRIQVDERVLKAAKSNRGAFINVMNVETEGLAEDMKKDLNRQLFGDGLGKIATLGTGASSTTQTFKSDTTRAQLRQIEVGMVLDIGTLTDADASGASLTVVSVNFANIAAATMVVSPTVSTTTGDFVRRAGVGAGGDPANVEVTGLSSIIDSTGSLFNVDPTTDPRWSSYEVGSVGAITDDALIAAIQETAYAAGDDGLDLFLTTNGVVRSYAASLAVQKRFANTMDMKGGFKGLSVGAGNSEVGLTDDKDCPAGTLFGVNSKHLLMHVAGDWEWMDLDGAIWSRQANKPSYEATLFRFHELTTDRRNSLAKLTGITDPANV